MGTRSTTRKQVIWRLVFVAGPQRGRTINLQRGENWIGSSPECGIVLAAEDISPRQLLLSVGDIAASVRNAGEGEASLNGALLDRQRRTIGSGDVVTLGKIKFEIERVSAEEIETTPTGNERTADYAWQKALKPAAGASAGLLSAKGAGKRLRTSWSVWAVVGGLILVSVGVFSRTVDADTPAGNAQVKAERVAALRRTLTGYPEVQIRDEDAGQIAIAGYVVNAEDRRKVQELVRQSALPASFDVHVASDALNRAKQFLNGTNVTAEYDESKNIVLSGTVSQLALAQRVKNFVADMAGTVKVVDKVQYNIARPVTAGPALPTIVGVFIDRSGGTRWIQTADGKRYGEGNHIKDGLQVVKISLDQVDFMRNGERVAWRVGQRDMQ